MVAEMKDLVFTCPSCRKPLMVEARLSGKKLICPMCAHSIRVPVVKEGLVRGARNAPSSRVARHMRRIRGIKETVIEIEESLASMQRREPEQEDDLDLLCRQAHHMVGQLQLIHRQLTAKPRGFTVTGAETVPSERPPWIAIGLLVLSVAFAVAASWV